MAYTSDRTWVTGEVVTASYMNTYIRDNIKWLSTDKPMFNGSSGTGQSLSASVYTGINYGSENFNNYGTSFHSTSSNPSRISAPSGVGGKYIFGAFIEFSWSSIGVFRLMAVRANGSAIWSQGGCGTVGSSGTTPVSTSAVISLSALGYAELCSYQDSGGALTIAGLGSIGWAMWVGV